ncbi:hypothetical protein BDN70DRAFT_65393 [Pholiota conissans]|uniref:Uncharacterized protein n=1 Tax=Pholiota conissans TaxID=109636 RepID=A0A9P5Z111_9AGAR|nr:hypothetical protein BDN70DRAFT_65393 [Pholiota conissans]
MSASQSTVSVIPAGHTFLSIDTFLTTKAKDMAENLLNQAQNRNPDMFDMYVHNDYYAYGVFNLVDKTLASLNTQIKKKDWKEAYIILEALIAFLEVEDTWTQCDDGDRVRVTRKAIGAAALTALQGLQGMPDFRVISHPSLESLLKNIVQLCEDGEMIKNKYAPLFIGMARRLFSEKTEADFARERDMLTEFARTMRDEEDKKDLESSVKKMAEDRRKALAAGEPLQPWFTKGVGETKIPNELKFARVWKEYKEYQAEVPKQPLMGPPKWDLSTWTDAEKHPYLFSTMDDDM